MDVKVSASSITRTVTVALIGNPNIGKATLFQHLSGGHHQEVHFPGADVRMEIGIVHHAGMRMRIVDLPGIYSLSSTTPDEVICRDFIMLDRPDVVINVLDAGNLERNLFLTTQLIEMGVPRVYALNMSDEAHMRGMRFDMEALSMKLGGPIIETVARFRRGIDDMLDAVVDTLESGRKFHDVAIAYDEHLEEAIDGVQQLVRELHPETMSAGHARWLAIKALEGDKVVLRRESDHESLVAAIEDKCQDIVRMHGDDAAVLLADGRYGFITGLMQQTVQMTGALRHVNITDLVDNLLLHRVLGLPLFLGAMWLMFQATFTLGQYPMAWLDTGVVWLGDTLTTLLPAGLTRDLLVDGIIGGVGGILIFLPNIMILFLFIAFFETTGYMSRAAFLMDQVMHGIGLHGKAFIPLIMGFGCNVPAIMATRAIESRRDRLLCILIAPFMSCSARLPVYVLFAGVFFADWAGTVVFGMHIAGVVVALGAALMLRTVLFRGEGDAFVMELPPYRLPTIRALIMHMWDKAVHFLRKIAGVVFVGSIIIWFLQAFPREVELSRDYDAERAAVVATVAAPDAQQTALAQLDNSEARELQKERYLGQIGVAIQPLFEPLGFNWQASIALMTGMIAKEIVVSTFGVLYNVGGDVDEGNDSLRSALAGAMPPLVALAFMVFTLLYMPCLATIAAIRREAGTWGWAAFSIVLSLALAWLMALLVIMVGGMLA